MRTVDESCRVRLSASALPVEDTPMYEEAAVSTPPLQSLVASKTTDKSMQHLPRLCEPGMPGCVTLSLQDGQQALVTDSSSIIDGPIKISGGDLEQPAA